MPHSLCFCKLIYFLALQARARVVVVTSNINIYVLFTYKDYIQIYININSYF